MNDWPEGWSSNRNGGERYGRGAYSPRPEGARAMPTVRRDRTAHAPGVPSQAAGSHDGYGSGTVYGGGAGGDGSGGGRAEARPRPNWGRRIKFTALTLAVVLLVTGVATYFWADGKMRREVDLAKVEERPSSGEGTTYLIVGSDSREGLSREDQKRLRTGSTEGKRTDSMMLLHRGPNGNTMVSLPRDSWVTIPEFTGSSSGKRIPAQQQKLNAAFSIEGPELLVRTIEYNTGLRIDHYAEIGFGGFAGLVDSLGGVEMCFDKAVKDKNSGADFQPGCHRLDGAESLAFVRNRYNAEGGDLGRTKNQQKFLAALADESATPSTVLNPFRLYPTIGAGLDSLIVDKDMSLYELARMFWAMKGLSGGDGTQMNMPLDGPFTAPGGQSALKWDMPRVKQLMEQLRNGDKVTVKGD
ncbi:LCP family protein [Streptomyces alkaliterrae]|uniref:LCP family protein n=1 Tax=Streptomyces alkaliterrae TaxID=2213162 RepID=A0A5P0YWM2_9ACTN|nr:LCP family protein [Streptomyces alkaliterrae]MBB1254379.1 LCP family protein [Streptomyces alkaliterrae]MBB1258424.1 LCP family protein [Streptomyces alkaliterrae]MQS02889.1 LytR family transcriptional regulator [Streptomyces alkaliterrae]